MGFRYRKSIGAGKYFRINVSKSGIGYSFGVPGVRITHSANGRVTTTVGLPGTGISYSTSQKNSNSTRKSNTTQNTKVMSSIIRKFPYRIFVAGIECHYSET